MLLVERGSATVAERNWWELLIVPEVRAAPYQGKVAISVDGGRPALLCLHEARAFAMNILQWVDQERGDGWGARDGGALRWDADGLCIEGDRLPLKDGDFLYL